MYVPGISHHCICDTRLPYPERSRQTFRYSYGHLPCRTSCQRERGSEMFRNHRPGRARFDSGGSS